MSHSNRRRSVLAQFTEEIDAQSLPHLAATPTLAGLVAEITSLSTQLSDRGTLLKIVRELARCITLSGPRQYEKLLGLAHQANFHINNTAPPETSVTLTITEPPSQAIPTAAQLRDVDKKANALCRCGKTARIGRTECSTCAGRRARRNKQAEPAVPAPAVNGRQH